VGKSFLFHTVNASSKPENTEWLLCYRDCSSKTGVYSGVAPRMRWTWGTGRRFRIDVWCGSAEWSLWEAFQPQGLPSDTNHRRWIKCFRM